MQQPRPLSTAVWAVVYGIGYSGSVCGQLAGAFVGGDHCVHGSGAGAALFQRADACDRRSAGGCKPRIGAFRGACRRQAPFLPRRSWSVRQVPAPADMAGRSLRRRLPARPETDRRTPKPQPETALPASSLSSGIRIRSPAGFSASSSAVSSSSVTVSSGEIRTTPFPSATGRFGMIRTTGQGRPSVFLIVLIVTPAAMETSTNSSAPKAALSALPAAPGASAA